MLLTEGYNQWLKGFCEAGGGAHMTKPGSRLEQTPWSKPNTHSNPTNSALFRHKITLYRFNQGGGAHTIAGGSNVSRGLSPTSPLTLTNGYNDVIFSKFIAKSK